MSTTEQPRNLRESTTARERTGDPQAAERLLQIADMDRELAELQAADRQART